MHLAPPRRCSPPPFDSLALRASLGRSPGPVVGGRVETCVHCVGIWEPYSPDDIPDDVLKRQCDLKVHSAIFLDRLARKLGPVVRQFILVGSNSSGLTNWNFASYGASNAMLAAVGRRRLHDGMPATVCHLPTLSDVGIVASDLGTFMAQKQLGWPMINAASAVAKFESMLAEGVPEVFAAAAVSFHPGMINGLCRFLPCFDSSLVVGDNSEAIRGEVPKTLEAVLATVIWALADSLGVDESDVNASTALASLGMDSMGMMGFSQVLFDQFGYQIDRTAFAMTLGDLAKDVLKMTKTTAAAAVGGEDVGGEDVVGEEGDEVDHGADDDHGHGTTTTTTTTSLIGYNRRIADPKGVVLVCPGLENGEKRLTRLAFAQWERSDIQVLHVEKSVTGDVSILRRETIEEIVEDLVRGGYLETRGRGSDGKVSDERVGSGVAATSHLAARCPRTPPGYSPLATHYAYRFVLLPPSVVLPAVCGRGLVVRSLRGARGMPGSPGRPFVPPGWFRSGLHVVPNAAGSQRFVEGLDVALSQGVSEGHDQEGVRGIVRIRRPDSSGYPARYDAERRRHHRTWLGSFPEGVRGHRGPRIEAVSAGGTQLHRRHGNPPRERVS